MAKSSQPASPPQADAASNCPVHTIRHRSLKATVWRNENDRGPFYNVTIVRSYRDKETEDWHDTHSFGYDDLMNVAKLMYDAHSVISALRAKESSASKQAASSRGRKPAAPGTTDEIPY